MKKVLFSATVDSHILHFHLPYLKMFKEKGYEVHVATNTDEIIPFCDIKHKVCFERSPFKKNNLKAIKQMEKILLDNNFDIVHTHTPMGSVVTRLAYKKVRNKVNTRMIYTAHGFHFYKGAPLLNWLLFYPVEKYLSKYTDTLITINKEDYCLAKKKFKKCKNVEYVPGVGIDEEKFNFTMTKKEKLELRKSLGLKESDFVMIYPARLDKNKNQGLLIEVMEELIKKHKNIHLLLPGEDELNGYYQKMAKEKNVEKYVHFLGYRKDILKLLKISDLALATSHREGLPLNVMEAMYVGLPIIATDCRGQRDLVEDSVNGFIVDVNDYKKIADYIKKIYLSKSYYEKFGENSKEIIKKYLLKNIIDGLYKIYFKKKNVLHLLSSNSFSGAENVACTIIDLVKDNYNSFYCSLDGDISNVLENKNVAFLPIEKMKLKDIKKIIVDNQIDIIHAHDFRASLYASMFYKKCIVLSHLHKNDPKMCKLSLKSMIYLIQSKRFNKIIGVSDSIIEEYIFNNKIRDKYVTLHNFVNKEYVVLKAKEFPVKQKYDIFFFGRLSEEKNPLAFINIIHLLNNKKIKCIMIGDGPLKEKCKELIDNYSLNKNIDMVGFKSNPFPYIKVSKIGVMPSKFEGFGLTAVESMILNKPVFNSGTGGLKKIFNSNINLICNTLDEYVYKINEYFKNPEKYSINNESLNMYCDNTFYKNSIEAIYK